MRRALLLALALFASGALANIGNGAIRHGIVGSGADPNGVRGGGKVGGGKGLRGPPAGKGRGVTVPDPTAYFPFDSDTSDANGNWTGETSSNVTFVTGQVGNAANFNGTTSYIQFSAAGTDTFYDAGDFSWTAWINTNDAAGEDGGGRIWDKWNSVDIWMAIVQQPVGTTNGRLSTFTDYTSANAVSRTANEAFAENTWVHVAGVFVDADNEWTLYVNGSADTPTVVTGTGSKVSDATTGLKIGSATGSLSTAGTFNGEIDELKFWVGTALTAEEVNQDYINGS